MVKIQICIGTACHLRGSRAVVERIQQLISDNNLKDKIDMSGKFCLGECKNNGVSVSVNGREYDVMPDKTDEFFQSEILPLIS